jgi:glycosyltransferase involved in cell wall biosynthesis
MEKINKISVVMVIYNEEKIIGRALDSIKDIADEILILHDGPCTDKSLDICLKYTDKVYQTEKNYGVPGLILPRLFRKVKNPWILKIDSDEVVSPDMSKVIPDLVKDKKISGYTFIWPFINKKQKRTTQNWPRKMALYRKDKMHYFGFPHWDDPQMDGDVVDTPYVFHHFPGGGSIPTWKYFIGRTLGRYARLHAEYTLKPFESFDSFQYDKKEFPIHFKIRRNWPLLSAVPIAVLAFFKTLFTEGAWKEGYPAINESLQSLLYYPYVGWLVFKLKIGGMKNLPNDIISENDNNKNLVDKKESVNNGKIHILRK